MRSGGFPDRGRRSIEIAGVAHGSAPIPAGARVGNLVCSSGIAGKDASTGQLPEDGDSQVRHAFANMRTLLANAGAALGDVAKVTVFLKDNRWREAVNREWLACFPDPHDRPARHTLIYDLPMGMLVQLEILALVSSTSEPHS